MDKETKYYHGNDPYRGDPIEEDKLNKYDEQRCPHMRTKGDVDFCELTEKVSGRIHPCILMTYDTCLEFEDIKKEWAND